MPVVIAGVVMPRLVTYAVVLAFLILRCADAQQAIAQCSGVVNPCSERHHKRSHESETVPHVCPLGTNGSATKWFINGSVLSFTKNDYATFKEDEVLIAVKALDQSYHAVNITAHNHGEYDITCTTDGFNLSTYVICVVRNVPMKKFDRAPDLESDKVFYASPGTIVTLNGTYYYGTLDTLFIYNVTWYAVHGKTENVHHSGCSYKIDLFGHVFVYSTLEVPKSAEVEDEFLCVIYKIDLLQPQTFDILSRRFIVKLSPSLPQASAEIGGILCVPAFFVIFLIYVCWCLFTPIRSFVHHVFNVRRQPNFGEMPYDAFICFNDSSGSDARISYAALLKKLECEWHYRACIAGRDFELGNENMAESLATVIDNSQKCIFIIDGTFFDSRCCQIALQYALENQRKLICLLLTDEMQTNANHDRLKPLAKLGVVINWRPEKPKKSWFKRLLLPHHQWTLLKLHLPPNRSLYL